MVFNRIKPHTKGTKEEKDTKEEGRIFYHEPTRTPRTGEVPDTEKWWLTLRENYRGIKTGLLAKIF
jgi:hypothetical protein